MGHEANQAKKRYPRCVQCGRRKLLGIGNRFCCNACAVQYAVSVAQTKRWDADAQVWSAADPAAMVGAVASDEE